MEARIPALNDSDSALAYRGQCKHLQGFVAAVAGLGAERHAPTFSSMLVKT